MKKLILALLVCMQVNTASAVVVGALGGSVIAPLWIVIGGGIAAVVPGWGGMIYGGATDQPSLKGAGFGWFIAGTIAVIVGVIALDEEQNTAVFTALDDKHSQSLGLEKSDIDLYNSYVPEYNLVYDQVSQEVVARHLTNPSLDEAKDMFNRAADQIELNAEARTVFAKVMQKTIDKRR